MRVLIVGGRVADSLWARNLYPFGSAVLHGIGAYSCFAASSAELKLTRSPADRAA
jgi:hypothetical protein